MYYHCPSTYIKWMDRDFNPGSHAHKGGDTTFLFTTFKAVDLICKAYINYFMCYLITDSQDSSVRIVTTVGYRMDNSGV